MATSAPTPAADIEYLAQSFEREAAPLDAVRVDLRRDVEATRGRWEGLVAERFRNHTDGQHRQRQIALAHDRLMVVARQLRQAAASQAAARAPSSGTGGTAAP